MQEIVLIISVLVIGCQSVPVDIERSYNDAQEETLILPVYSPNYSNWFDSIEDSTRGDVFTELLKIFIPDDLNKYVEAVGRPITEFVDKSMNRLYERIPKAPDRNIEKESAYTLLAHSEWPKEDKEHASYIMKIGKPLEISMSENEEQYKDPIVDAKSAYRKLETTSRGNADYEAVSENEHQIFIDNLKREIMKTYYQRIVDNLKEDETFKEQFIPVKVIYESLDNLTDEDQHQSKLSNDEKLTKETNSVMKVNKELSEKDGLASVTETPIKELKSDDEKVSINNIIKLIEKLANKRQLEEANTTERIVPYTEIPETENSNVETSENSPDIKKYNTEKVKPDKEFIERSHNLTDVNPLSDTETIHKKAINESTTSITENSTNKIDSVNQHHKILEKKKIDNIENISTGLYPTEKDKLNKEIIEKSNNLTDQSQLSNKETIPQQIKKESTVQENSANKLHSEIQDHKILEEKKIDNIENITARPDSTKKANPNEEFTEKSNNLTDKNLLSDKETIPQLTIPQSTTSTTQENSVNKMHSENQAHKILEEKKIDNIENISARPDSTKKANPNEEFTEKSNNLTDKNQLSDKETIPEQVKNESTTFTTQENSAKKSHLENQRDEILKQQNLSVGLNPTEKVRPNEEFIGKSKNLTDINKRSDKETIHEQVTKQSSTESTTQENFTDKMHAANQRNKIFNEKIMSNSQNGSTGQHPTAESKYNIEHERTLLQALFDMFFTIRTIARYVTPSWEDLKNALNNLV